MRIIRAAAGWGAHAAAACTTLPPGAGLPRPVTHALDPTLHTPLEEQFATQARSHPDASGFRLLSVGIDGLAARVELIDAATRTLDLQYYLFRADESGSILATALLRAAERGVRVRLLLDDGETVPGDEKILSLTAKPGIEVRIFNPLRYRGHNRLLRGAEFLLEKGRLDYRMHNKLLVADNAVAIIGGRNIGDQYFQIDPESQFGDDDVILAGPMVRRLSDVFDQFWNGDLAIPAANVDRRDTSDVALSSFETALDAHQAPDAPAPHAAAVARTAAAAATESSQGPLARITSGRTPLIWAEAQLAYDSPDKKAVDDGDARGRLIYKALAEHARAINHELLMVTPYFIPSPDELAVIDADRAKGERVSILTNSLAAAPNIAAQSGYMHYRVALLARGVELHEIRPRLGSVTGSGQNRAISRYGNYALHAKIYVFDRKTLFIGSMNYDQRSRHLNTEIGLFIASPDLAKEAAKRFDELTRPEDAYALSLDQAGGDPHLVWTTDLDGHTVRYTTEPARSEWQRIKVRLFSLLPLDQEL